MGKHIEVKPIGYNQYNRTEHCSCLKNLCIIYLYTLSKWLLWFEWWIANCYALTLHAANAVNKMYLADNIATASQLRMYITTPIVNY